jgi:methionyl-tRNA formyltransferase
MFDTTARPILIASPHSRNDLLELRVRDRLIGREVVRIRTPQELVPENLEKLNPEFIFFPHWSWIIQSEIFTRFACVIFHMTDLPYGRGGSPLQNLIVRGHRETKLTALQCVAELDAGPIYMKRPLSLSGTAEEILQRASGLVEEMIVEIVRSRPESVPQVGQVVEFKRRQPKDGNISDLDTLAGTYDFIRMLDAEGYPPAFIDTEHMHLEFRNAELCDEFVEAKVRIRRKIK